MVSERRRSEAIAFLKHVKERRRLLEEEIKKEGGLGGKKSPRILDANGKPVKATIPLVDGSGKPLKDEFANVHMNEDIDAVMKSRLGAEKSMKENGAEKSMKEKGAEKGMKEKGAEKVTEKTTVPNFIGYSVADVNWLANQYGLYIQAKGTDRTDVYVTAAYQDIPEGTEVDKGTTITVEFTTGGASD